MRDKIDEPMSLQKSSRLDYRGDRIETRNTTKSNAGAKEDFINYVNMKQESSHGESGQRTTPKLVNCDLQADLDEGGKAKSVRQLNSFLE